MTGPVCFSSGSNTALQGLLQPSCRALPAYDKVGAVSPAQPIESLSMTGTRRLLLSLLTTTLLSVLVGPKAIAQKLSARYRRTAPGPEGIGKNYMGRDIAGVMGWQGAAIYCCVNSACDRE